MYLRFLQHCFLVSASGLIGCATVAMPPGQESGLPIQSGAESADGGDSAAAAPPVADRPYQPHPGDLAVSSPHWPGFRGTGSRGVADGQRPPLIWDVSTGENVLWETPVPGLGNSCPTIYGDQIFVTAAVSADGDNEVRIGLYGDVDSVDDDSEYELIVYCFDKRTGRMLWQRMVHRGQPAIKRHAKSSHANPTVACDGRRLVAFFGSEGLYCLSIDGKLLWNVDLGVLDSGYFRDADYQWGFGSSPLIFGDTVIVQCDIQQDSFIAAFDLRDGALRWRVPRDEIPTWSSPIVHRFDGLPMLITNGTRAARGYDARDGTLLWLVPDQSDIVVPTPLVAHDLIFLASGYSPIQPIVALRPEARGELPLPDRELIDEEDKAETGDESEQASGDQQGDAREPATEAIQWSRLRGGPYMPTPIVYGDLLYVCSNNGILACYRAESGQRVYRQRLRSGGTAAYTASPVAADGRIYFTAEDGQVVVVRAGERFEQLAVNSCGKTVLATPAISERVFYVRTLDSLQALAAE